MYVYPANSPFTARLDEFGQVIVRLKRVGGKPIPFEGKWRIK